MQVDEFVHRENLAFYKKQLTQAPNEAQRRQLFTLLTEEQRKDQKRPTVLAEWPVRRGSFTGCRAAR
jgi:hypothetical protein